MNSLIYSRTSVLWLLLILVTAGSWELGHGVGITDVRYASMAVIVVSFIKARFVLLDFMEVRHAPRAIRFICEAWVLLVCAGLVALYAIASGNSVA